MRASLLLLLALAMTTPAWAQKGVAPTTVIVGGSPMVSDKDLLDDLPNSAEHTVYLTLLHASGLADMLRGRGPFTVFAPTDAAFAALPPGTVEMLQRPENKARLVTLLSDLILPGNFSLARFQYILRSYKGQVDLDTINNAKLTVSTNGPGNIILKDAKGQVARILVYDVKQANGVMYVIDRVLMPG